MASSVVMICGIDPGIHGGIAFYDPARPNVVEAFDLPTVHRVIDGRNLASLIRERPVAVVAIEAVGSMPGQGVSSTFAFGRAFGTLIGIVEALGLRIIYATPSRWKRAMHLDSEAETSRKMALDTFPGSAGLFARKKDHNRAEAALLALFVARTDAAKEDAA